MIQSRVVVPEKHFFFVGYLSEDFFRAQYFTKVVAANHSSTDTLFLRRTLATTNYIYKINLTDLFNPFMMEAVIDWFLYDNGLRHERVKADFYFKGALAAIHLSCSIIFSGGHLQWSSIFNCTVYFLNKHLQSSLFS